MKLVEVLWEDAETSSGWIPPEAVEGYGKTSLLCIQVGLLLSKDKNSVVLSSGYNTLGHAQGLMRIPTGMIRKIRVLGKVTEID